MIKELIWTILSYMPKRLVWFFSKRYVSGESVHDAINATKRLNAQGIMVTIDILGELITSLDEAEANKHEYLELIHTAEKENLDANYSLKPTMFGLLIDPEVCFGHIKEIVQTAAQYDNFIRIDMEESKCTDLEIDIFKRLYREFPNHVGLALQAYLKRTSNDISEMKRLSSQNQVINFRLCKGIYNESETITYKNYEEINAHFLKDLELMIQNGMYSAIATHDTPLIDGAYQLIQQYHLKKHQYEFQMLFGVRPELRRTIIQEGHRMRVYIPYGKDWKNYCIRRIKDPKIGQYVLRALLKRA